MAFRPIFEAAAVKAVGLYAGARGLTETDLMEILRGSWRAQHPPIDGVSWSFGAYDFRTIIGRLVSAGRLVETLGQERGGGRETRYTLSEEVPSA